MSDLHNPLDPQDRDDDSQYIPESDENSRNDADDFDNGSLNVPDADDEGEGQDPGTLNIPAGSLPSDTDEESAEMEEEPAGKSSSLYPPSELGRDSSNTVGLDLPEDNDASATDAGDDHGTGTVVSDLVDDEPHDSNADKTIAGDMLDEEEMSAEDEVYDQTVNMNFDDDVEIDEEVDATGTVMDVGGKSDKGMDQTVADPSLLMEEEQESFGSGTLADDAVEVAEQEEFSGTVAADSVDVDADTPVAMQYDEDDSEIVSEKTFLSHFGDEDPEQAGAEKTVASDFAADPEHFEEDRSYRQTVNAKHLSPEDRAKFEKLFQDDQATRAPNYAARPEPTPSTAPFRGGIESNLVISSKRVQLEEGTEPEVATADPHEYEFEGKLGEGGMGTVFLSRQRSLDRMVALKMLKPIPPKDAEKLKKSGRLEQAERQRRDQFISEAVVTGDLDHPNIVPIFDCARTESGELFYSMRRVMGKPWSEAVEGAKRDERFEAENLQVLDRVCDAMAFAHSKNVVHRDLKPENVFLGDFGEVVVMDWGLAVPQENFSKKAYVQKETTFGGSPAYMAPEMGHFRNPRITHSTDIYLLGAILYEIITGFPPHAVPRSATLGEISKIVRDNRIRPTKRTGELVEIARKAMATFPEDRYASVQEFQAAIRDYLSHKESLDITHNSEEELEHARQSDVMKDYRRAIAGFENAIKLWEGNTRAKRGLAEAQLAISEAALAQEDFVTPYEELDPDNEEHAPILKQVEIAKQQRDGRKKRLKIFQTAALALLFLVLVGSTGAAIVINGERTKAIAARDEAKRQEGLAIEAKDEAEKQEQIALAEKAKTEEQRLLAVKAQKETEKALNDVKLAQAEEKKQRELAEQNEMKAVAAAELAKENELAAVMAQKETEEALNKVKIAQAEEAKQRMKAEENEKKAVAAAELAKKNEMAALKAQKETEEALNKVKIAQAEEAKQRMKAEENEKKAVAAAELAKKNEMAAVKAQKETEVALNKVKIAQAEEAKQRMKAEENEKKAVAAADLAQKKQKEAEAAQQAEALAKQEAVYESFAAKIGLARLRIQNNEFEDANRILTDLQETEEMKDLLGWEFRRLKYLTEQGSREKLSEPVTAVSVSPSGDKVAAGLTSGQIRMFDLSVPDNRIPSLQPDLPNQFSHGQNLQAMAFSPNETVLATAGLYDHNSVIRLWDTKTGNEIEGGRLAGHEGLISSIAFAENGDFLVTGSEDTTMRVWNLRNREQVELSRQLYPVVDLDYSARNKAIAAALASSDGRGGKVAVYNLNSNGQLQTRGEFNQHRGPVYAVAFSTQGDTLVSGGKEINPLDGEIPGRPNEEIRKGSGLLLKWNLDQLDRVSDYSSLISKALAATETNQKAATRYRAEILGVHDDSVRSLQFSESGDRLVSSSDDFTVKLWDPASKRLLKTLRGHGNWVRDVSFVPETEDVVVSGSEDGDMRLWSVANYNEFIVLQDRPRNTNEDGEDPRHKDEVLRAVFDRTGDRVISGSRDRTAKMWDVRTGEELMTFADDAARSATANSGIELGLTSGQNLANLREGHELVALFADYSPNGKYVLTVGVDQSARLWSADTPATKELAVITGIGLNVKPAISADSQWILTGGDDNVAQLWNIPELIRAFGQRLEPQPTFVLTGHETPVTAVAISPQREYLLTASEQGRQILWDFESGERIGEPIEEHLGRINAVQFLPEANVIAAAGDDQRVTLYDFEKWELVRELSHSGGVQQLVIDPRGTRLLAISVTTFSPSRKISRLYEWPLMSTEAPTILWEDNREIRSVGFSSDGEVAVTAHPPRDPNATAARARDLILVWNTKSGQFGERRPTKTLSVPVSLAQTASLKPGEQSTTLLTLGDNVAYSWNIQDGEFEKRFAPHSIVTSVDFSFDGKYVATGSIAVKIWDADPTRQSSTYGQSLFKLEKAHTQLINSIDFSPLEDSYQFVTASNDRTVKLWQWNPEQGDVKLLSTFAGEQGHTAAVRSARFSPDGKYIASAGIDGTVRLWSVETGKSISLPTDNQEQVGYLDVAFSTDGKMLAAGMTNKLASVWNLEEYLADNNRKIDSPIKFVGHAGAVESVTFFDNNRRLLTGSEDRSIRVWDASPLSEFETSGERRELMTLGSHDGGVTSVDANADDSKLVSAGRDGRVILWPAR